MTISMFTGGVTAEAAIVVLAVAALIGLYLLRRAARTALVYNRPPPSPPAAGGAGRAAQAGRAGRAAQEVRRATTGS